MKWEQHANPFLHQSVFDKYRVALSIENSENYWDEDIDIRFKEAFREEIIAKFVDNSFLFLSSDEEMGNTSFNNATLNISLMKKNFEEDNYDSNMNFLTQKNLNKNSRNSSIEKDRSFSMGKNYSFNQKYGSISINEFRNFIEKNEYLMNSVLFLKEILMYLEREKMINFKY